MDSSMWQVGAELGAVTVGIDGAELAAYRQARMSARLPEVVREVLAASCMTDFAISRTLTTLGRSALLQGHHIEVRGIGQVQSLAPIVAPCMLRAALRVLGCSPRGPGGMDVTLAVRLGHEPDSAAVATFELELRLQRRVAA